MIKNKMAKFTKSVLAFLFLFVTNQGYSATLENLDEAINRKPRLPNALWGRTLLEGVSPTYYWQPETLNYSDIATGNEVWRITYTPSRNSSTEDIGYAHWSADGNRLAFGSDRPTAAKPAATVGDRSWMLINTDGSRFRTGFNLSCSNWNWSNYPAWNPAFKDVMYLPGYGAGGSYNTLYANTITDTAISKSAIVSVDNTTTYRLWLKKGMASDGSKLLFSDFFGSATWVADLASGSLDTPTTGYNRKLAWDTYWGDTPASPTQPLWHDNYVAGAAGAVNGIWNYVLPNGSYTWWRAKLTGSGPDHAPAHIIDHTAPYVWGGELEPIGGVNTGIDPFTPKADYFSHLAIDRWGKYGIHSKTTNLPAGTSLIVLGTANYWNSSKVFSGAGLNIGGNRTQHHDWDAWSDWSVSSGSPYPSDFLDYRTHVIATQNFKDSVSQRIVAYTHNFVNNGGIYNNNYYALPRPTQSPDGTKIMFNSAFLNSSESDAQMFWAVAYYPYPPEIKSASKNLSNVRLTWDFNQGSAGAPNYSTARTYATRGWPHETNDRPPSPREIDRFRVWGSNDGVTWLPLGTTSYNNCRGNNECGKWTESAWSFDANQAVNSTRYYAVTSLEYSGLESHTLSNVWKVILDADGNIIQQLQQSGYPVNPGGKSSFYSTPPPSIIVQFSHKEAPATADGQYVVKWNAPMDASMIRYYNIYAKDGGAPLTNATPLAERQKFRIASIPASSDYANTGTFRYIDWLGAIDGSTKYVVTAVDYQGNETQFVDTPAPVQNVIRVTPLPKVEP